MGLYQELENEDVVEYLRPAFQSGGYEWTSEGKIKPRTGVAIEGPWVFVRPWGERNCNLCHRLLLDALGKLPFPGMDCWKVVVKPRKLNELFALLEIQDNCGYPCKCGVESRPSVHGLYGGYFYNKTLEQGQECWRFVRREVSKHISPDVPVILKRGCTEIEHMFGPSHKWKIEPKELEMQKRVAKLLEVEDLVLQHPVVREHVIRGWIQFAFRWGDESYKMYTDGKPLYEPYVCYHPNAETPPDEELTMPTALDEGDEELLELRYADAV